MFTLRNTAAWSFALPGPGNDKSDPGGHGQEITEASAQTPQIMEVCGRGCQAAGGYAGSRSTCGCTGMRQGTSPRSPQ